MLFLSKERASAGNSRGGPEKAAELAKDGCLDITITAPDGHQYQSQAFDQLPTDG
jgi:hypothetical protein